MNQPPTAGATTTESASKSSKGRGSALVGVGLGLVLFLAAAVLFFIPPSGDDVSSDDWTISVSCASPAFGDDSVQGNAPSDRFDGLSTDLQMTCMTGRQQHSSAALLLAVLGSTAVVLGATRRR